MSRKGGPNFQPVDADEAHDRARARKLMLDSTLLDPRTADDLRDKGARLANRDGTENDAQ